MGRLATETHKNVSRDVGVLRKAGKRAIELLVVGTIVLNSAPCLW